MSAADATEAELKAKVDAALERVSAAERSAASAQAQIEDVEEKTRAAAADRQRIAAATASTQAACRTLQLSNKDLEQESQRIADEGAARREELRERIEEALADVQKSTEGEARERERVTGENVKSREQLARFETQRDATRRHRDAEAHAKDLELRLHCARLAEVIACGWRADGMRMACGVRAEEPHAKGLEAPAAEPRRARARHTC